LDGAPARAGCATFEIIDLDVGRGKLARRILTALPEWFGIPEAVDAYVEAAESLPMLAARIPDGRLVGFLSLKRHTPVAAEAYVLGVLREWHGQGCGRALFGAAEERLAAAGVRYLTVKTLAAGNLDPNHGATRRFYETIGFEPIEVFETLWDEGNPCLLMKVLGAPHNVPAQPAPQPGRAGFG
jgi:ribosomal protein S18 acetylase RimI-like enzyme